MLYGLHDNGYFDSNLDILVEDAVSDAKRQDIIDICWNRLEKKLLSCLTDVSKLNFDMILYPVDGNKYKAYKFSIGRLSYAFVDKNAYVDDYAFDDDQDCICFFILDNDGNTLDSNDLLNVLKNEKAIKHELTHWLDSFRISPMRSNDPNRIAPQGKEYYRSPIESNAFTTMLENIFTRGLHRNKQLDQLNVNTYIKDMLDDIRILREGKPTNLVNDQNLINYVQSLREGQYKRLRIRLISYVNFTYYRLTNNLKAIDYKKYNEDPLLNKRK